MEKPKTWDENFKTCTAAIPSLHHSSVNSDSENHRVLSSLGVSSPHVHGLPPLGTAGACGVLPTLVTWHMQLRT